MSNPWLSIPLDDYEAHMSCASVQQSAALAELFKCALDYCLPRSVAVLGVAGGNGLEQIDAGATRRVVGVDNNQKYLDEVRQRFGSGRLEGLELYCHDLAERDLSVTPVALVHAALLFEHTGLGRALKNAHTLVAPGGHLSVVLQSSNDGQQGVTSTSYTSMQSLNRGFAMIDKSNFQRSLEREGLEFMQQEFRELPTGKTLWLGIFANRHKS
jgi:SAM-dependent methyltransferase